jgi:hypothetical protein
MVSHFDIRYEPVVKKEVLNSSVCYLCFLAGPIQLASLQHRNAADRSLADTEKMLFFRRKSMIMNWLHISINGYGKARRLTDEFKQLH